MRTLHLMRHAKSAWDRPDLSDRERVLNKRGMRDAPRMGIALANEIAPQCIAVSPARRAQLTLEGLCSTWPALAGFDHAIEEPLYTFEAQNLLRWISNQPEQQHSLFLIGHNPALTELVNELTGSWTLDNLPTAGYARLSLDLQSWSQVQAGCSSLERTLFPKQLSKD
ncbi:MAG: histidine phosphatase family protein [Halioglobus sp.]